MAQDFAPNDDRHDRNFGSLSDAEVARIVVQLGAAVALKRRAGLTRLFAHAEAVPRLPIKPSRMEISILIALVQTYGAVIVDNPRFYPVVDFVAERGAVALVQRVMYGDAASAAAPNASVNETLASRLKAARPAFEFLCGTWPEVFMAQANAVLMRLGLPTLAPPPSRELLGRPREADDEGSHV